MKMKLTMAKNIIYSFLFITLAATLFSFVLPAGWYKSGTKPQHFEFAVDSAAGPDGGNAATIKSIKKRTNGSGSLLQQCKPGKFLGKRLRMTAFVKTEKVKGWAGLWLSAGNSATNKLLSVDNMYDRKIKGTTGWIKYEIVLDIPSSGTTELKYGAFLWGEGQIWFDKIAFEIVDNSVKPTGINNADQSWIKTEPDNLDFEK